MPIIIVKMDFVKLCFVKTVSVLLIESVHEAEQ